MSEEVTTDQLAAPAPRVPVAMSPVESSQIAEAGYNEARQTFAVTFKSGPGTVYQFPDVDAELYRAFVASPSKGKFFGAHFQGRFCHKFPPLAPKAA